MRLLFKSLHRQASKLLLCLCNILVRSAKDIAANGLERLIVKFGKLCGQVPLHWLDVVEECFEITQRLPANKDLELGKCHGDLRLVIVVGVLFGIRLVQFRRQLLVRVDLEWQSFLYGENLFI